MAESTCVKRFRSPDVASRLHLKTLNGLQAERLKTSRTQNPLPAKLLGAPKPVRFLCLSNAASKQLSQ